MNMTDPFHQPYLDIVASEIRNYPCPMGLWSGRGTKQFTESERS